VQRCVDEVMKSHGRIDVLVNAGAINPQFARISDMSYERLWVPTMIGEADIVFLMCKAVWPHMQASGGGSIINFARPKMSLIAPSIWPRMKPPGLQAPTSRSTEGSPPTDRRQPTIQRRRLTSMPLPMGNNTVSNSN
jgi:Enoyl-(Acyl carrier protein) reductase